MVIEPEFAGDTVNQTPLNRPLVEALQAGVGRTSSVAEVLSPVIEPLHGMAVAPAQASLVGGGGGAAQLVQVTVIILDTLCAAHALLTWRYTLMLAAEGAVKVNGCVPKNPKETPEVLAIVM